MIPPVNFFVFLIDGATPHKNLFLRGIAHIIKELREQLHEFGGEGTEANVRRYVGEFALVEVTFYNFVVILFEVDGDILYIFRTKIFCQLRASATQIH
jgi:hypothetical protein